MRRHWLLAAALALVLASPAEAAPTPPSGTIAGPDQPAPYAFGDAVSFTTTWAGLRGTQYPMVYVECYSVVDGVKLWGALRRPDDGFTLGGGSSLWHVQRDDAVCEATLRAYGGNGQTPYIVILAGPVSFVATG